MATVGYGWYHLAMLVAVRPFGNAGCGLVVGTVWQCWLWLGTLGLDSILDSSLGTIAVLTVGSITSHIYDQPTNLTDLKSP